MDWSKLEKHATTDSILIPISTLFLAVSTVKNKTTLLVRVSDLEPIALLIAGMALFAALRPVTVQLPMEDVTKIAVSSKAGSVLANPQFVRRSAGMEL